MDEKEFREKMEAITDDELIDLADKELSALCKTGGETFTMTVPPRVTDTDMLFSELIRRFKTVKKGGADE